MKKNCVICVLLILMLPGAKTSMGVLQNSSHAPDKFNGFFRQETYRSGKQKENSPIPASLVFQEGENGSKYAVYIPFFVALFPQREYNVQGIVVQKQLPAKAKDADYRRIIQSAWPDFASGDIKKVAKDVKDWVSKNPDMPLLFINSLQRIGSQPVQVEEFALMGKVLKRVSPVYPQAARLQNIKGNVTLEVIVDEDGNVEQIKAVSGHTLLVDASVEAVRQWKFSQTIIEGKAVVTRSIIITTFLMWKE